MDRSTRIIPENARVVKGFARLERENVLDADARLDREAIDQDRGVMENRPKDFPGSRQRVG
jgi:hypothetical protein